MASVEGSLSKVGVPELFRAIAREGRTGSLTLTRSGAEARVFFRDGDAYHARSIGSGVQLGARLISAGAITNDDLNDALALQKAEGGSRRLGQILVDQQVVSSQELQAIVAQQIEDTIFEILRWDGGEFRFDQDVLTDEDIGLQVSVENLVMEGARRFREWHQITRRVPTLEAIPIFNEDSTEIDVALTPEEWAFVSRVDGKATIKELGIGCGFTDLEAGRTVFGLVTAGLLEIELPAGVELPLDDADLDEVFDELERALQEAAAPRRDEQGPQPTLEELVIGQATVEPSDPISLAEVAISEPPPAIAEVDADLPGLDELPEIEDARRDPSVETEYALSGENLPSEDLVVTDGWAQPETEAMVPSGQEWAEPEPDVPQVQVIPTGHDLEAPSVLEEVAESELLEEVDAETELPVLEEVAEVAEQPLPAEAEAPPVNGSSPEPSPVATGPWGDLRVQEVVEHAEAEPVASWLNPGLDDAHQVEAVEVSAAVIVEEPVDVHGSQPMTGNSVARLFAELSSPGSDQLTATSETPVPDASEQEAAPAKETGERPTPRPVDPSVDTTALLREFSGLGLKDEQASPDWGQMESPRRPASADADKGRGLFGKKKR